MKKLMMVGLLLTVAFALQAQVKIAPMMQKGTVKNYVAVAIATLPGQGDVKITTDTKYTITDATADGYVLEMVSTDVKTECDPNNIAGKLMAAAEEMIKGTVIRVTLDKDGRVQNILNGDEVKAKLDKQADVFIDQMMTEIPQLAQVLSKDALKQQVAQSLTTDALVKSMQEATSPLALNGKTLVTGLQDEFVSKEGMKMKRMYFVNGKSIVANSLMNMSDDEMKKFIIKQVEQSAPDQAQMIKDNIDTVLDSGLLKLDMNEKASYELTDDLWVKSMETTMESDIMGQKSSTIVKTQLKN